MQNNSEFELSFGSSTVYISVMTKKRRRVTQISSDFETSGVAKDSLYFTKTNNNKINCRAIQSRPSLLAGVIDGVNEEYKLVWVYRNRRMRL